MSEFYSLSEAQNLLKNYENKSSNEFQSEMVPLVKIAEYVNDPDILIKFISRSSNDDIDGVDGVIKIKKFEQKIQFTTAWTQENYSNRDKYSKIHKITPMFQDIYKVGTKNKGEHFPEQPLAYNPEKEEKLLFEVIKKIIHKKLDSKYKGMWLCITLPDTRYVHDELKDKINNFFVSCHLERMISKIYSHIFFHGCDFDGQRYLIPKSFK